MWWNDGKESMDNWILNQWLKNGGKGFGTNKQSKHWIFNDYWTKWGEMGRSNDGITSWFGQDQREWEKHLWMKSNQSNNQYSKLISIELSGMDDPNQ